MAATKQRCFFVAILTHVLVMSGAACSDDDIGDNANSNSNNNNNSEPFCGNSLKEANEDCDGTDLGGASCASQGLGLGTLGCAEDCTFLTGGCQQVGCGNGIAEPAEGEACDLTDLMGATCEDHGFAGGALLCTSSCTVDTSQCVGSCGNGVTEPGERCDDGNISSGDGCSSDCEIELGWLCVGTPSLCGPVCGDGLAVGAEVCDGGDLGNASCLTMQFDGGSLTCDASCLHDTDLCWNCGDGVCGPAEMGQCAADCAPTVSAGMYYTCANSPTGMGWCWGYNFNGQLGTGNAVSTEDPAQVVSLADIVSISAHSHHSCASRGTGDVWCWGDNSDGQLGDGTVTSSATPVPVADLTDVRSVDTGGVPFFSGYFFTCALQHAGSIWCWGDGGAGKLGNGSTASSSTPVSVSNLSTAVNLSVGGGHSCAVLNDGTAWCWGMHTHGQLGDGSGSSQPTPSQVVGLTNVVQISAGAYHSCAADGQGTAWCWGQGLDGQLGDGLETASATAVEVASLTDVVWVSAGGYHSCAVLDDGSAWCWGDGTNGRLGSGSGDDQPVPVQVQGPTDFVSISAGYSHTCGYTASGALWCWGNNDYGQIGDGTQIHRYSPVLVSGL